jgi:hypothetical protein
MEERVMVSFRLVSLAALALGMLATPQGRSDEHARRDRPATSRPVTGPANLSYVVYSLDELGTDPDFGAWVAETIPEVIAPGTWKGPGVLRFYAPRNILVVSHTAAVQTQVRGFLTDVKKSLPRGEERRHALKTPPRDQAVAPAEYLTSLPVKASDPVPEQPRAYPVPAPGRPPKHLFHFIIRYEGQGIIDNNVVQALKTQYGAASKEAESKESGATPAAGSGMPIAVSPLPPAAVKTDSQPTLCPAANKAEKEDKKTDKKDEKQP